MRFCILGMDFILPSFTKGMSLPMTNLCTMLLLIIATLTVIMPPRIYYNWMQFNAYRREEEQEQLIALQSAENQWMLRHLACSFAAIVMVAYVKLHPTMEGAEQLSVITAAYAVLSILFAVTESLFAQKIERVMMAVNPDESRRDSR